MPSHETYMQRCVELALYGAGKVSPNPMVGAVLVYQDEIIGEGFHQQYGGPHAEVNCIHAVPAHKRHLIAESTLYVSLEPCSHYGKTPPCADLIVHHHIPRVVIGSLDPNPLVAGKGIEKLRAAGVNVKTGVLQNKTDELNKRFFALHKLNRPYVILKWAQTADGYLSLGENDRLKITGRETDTIVHKWRAEEDAIMVGRRTALLDNPRLTVRWWKGCNPVRVVVDPQVSLPTDLSLFDRTAPLLVLNTVKDAEVGAITYQKISRSEIPEILSALKSRNIGSVIVEGGAALLNSFLASGLWDEARVITNKGLFIGKGLSSPKMPDGEMASRIILGQEEIIFLRNTHTQGI